MIDATITKGPILIVEDNKKTADLVALYLEREGFETIKTDDGKQALELARQHNPVFAILDLMLPNADGWEICQELRRSCDVPILILTARQEEADRILGLTLGADDYVIKPFSPGELVARVKAILRRARSEPAPSARVLSYQGLRLYPEKHKFTVNGQAVPLTPSEFTLLEVLMSTPGHVFLRDELLNKLYPNGETVVDRVIDVHIGNLRQKIEADPSSPQFILTIRGIGYRFADFDDE